jgi:hypothetical protein
MTKRYNLTVGEVFIAFIWGALTGAVLLGALIKWGGV